MKIINLIIGLSCFLLPLGAVQVSEQDLNLAMADQIKKVMPRFAEMDVLPQVVLRSGQKFILSKDFIAPQVKVMLSDRQNVSGTLYATVDIYDQNKLQDEMRCQFKLKILADVYHAKNSYQKNIVVQEEMFYLKRINVLGSSLRYITKGYDFKEKSLLSKISADEPLLEWKVRKKPLVNYGDLVTVSFVYDNINVKVPGKVLQQGYGGERIRVLIPDNQKVFKAEVIDKTNLQVKL